MRAGAEPDPAPTVGAAALEPTASLTVERVLWVRHWNDRLFSFSVTRPMSMRFSSGEFVMLGLPGPGGRPLLRAYSIASPDYSDELEFLSVKVDDGPLTSRLQHLRAGDEVYLGRKPTGTLVMDALLPARRLFLLSTGTGLAPFLSTLRDPQTYDRFEHVALVHSVRRVSDLAYRDALDALLAEDPLVSEQALTQLTYLPTVTREAFPRHLRISPLLRTGEVRRIGNLPKLDPATDRVMLCGSMAMIRDLAAELRALGFEEGSNASPGHFVVERAFVD